MYPPQPPSTPTPLFWGWVGGWGGGWGVAAPTYLYMAPDGGDCKFLRPDPAERRTSSSAIGIAANRVVSAGMATTTSSKFPAICLKQ